MLFQPSFLQAELLKNGKVIAYTAEDGKYFEPRILIERVQRVQKYSFQRTFVEAYRFDDAYENWKTGKEHQENPPILAQTQAKTTIERNIPFPSFELYQAKGSIKEGTVTYDKVPDHPFNDRAVLCDDSYIKSFPKRDLEYCLSDEGQSISYSKGSCHPPMPINDKKIVRDTYIIIDFYKNISGFVGCTITCENACTVYLFFDEVLSDDDVDFLRGGCCNAIKLELTKGTHPFESFETYTMRYLKVVAKEAACHISDVYIRRYRTGVKITAQPSLQDKDLLCIYQAAVDTFCDNAVDILTDCPSRERAGWLCDSYFIARAEFCLTGKNDIEHNYLENYLLPEKFDYIPDGMLPMCYPADDHEMVFIPNWAMWFILELEDYFKRSRDRTLVDAFKIKFINCSII